MKIQTFTDLITWQEGHKLAVSIYRATKDFPKDELFGITNQMRRAAVSITSNIAEGFSRKSAKEKYQFYSIANGSLTELQNQLLISKDVKYLSVEDFNKLSDQTIIVHKYINALLTSTNLHSYVS